LKSPAGIQSPQKAVILAGGRVRPDRCRHFMTVDGPAARAMRAARRYQIATSLSAGPS
jgi:hypothetical protein